MSQKKKIKFSWLNIHTMVCILYTNSRPFILLEYSGRNRLRIHWWGTGWNNCRGLWYYQLYGLINVCLSSQIDVDKSTTIDFQEFVKIMT